MKTDFKIAQMNMLDLEMTEARRRFRLHIIWSGVCAAVAIAAYTAGVVACLTHIAEGMHR